MSHNWIDIALTQLGKKFNSSGAFVAFVMNNAHIMPSSQQIIWTSDLVELVSNVHGLKSIDESTPGDLLFWGISDQPYSVGIYIGGRQFVAVDANDHCVKIKNLNQAWYPKFSGRVFK